MLVALAAIVPACASGAAEPVDPPPGDDGARLQGCIARAADDETALNGCKGVVYEACLREWEASTQTAAMCWTGEWNVWHAEMDAALVRRGEADSERSAQLRASQQAWAAWLEIECAYRAAGMGGGGGTGGARASCAADLTADRVISLMLD